MSSRRPRIKPVANLTARRVDKTEKSVEEKSTDEEPKPAAIKEEIEVVTEFVVNDGENAIVKNDETDKTNDEILKIENSISLPSLSQGQPIVAATTSNRRRIKPTIVLPQRKSKIIPTNIAKKDDSIVKDDNRIQEPAVNEEIQIDERIVLEHIEIINPPSNESGKVTNFEEPIDDSVFKSPQNFLSPRYNPPTPKTNPFGNEISPLMLSTNELTVKDDIRCPLSPTKIRQRIKAVPMLGNRRNSMQGRDECDDIPRRQRHLSSSSSHSNQNASYKTMNSPGYPYSNRIRTESSCSNGSDMSVAREVVMTQKIRRSEEHCRLNEAKRGFRERFQNTVPDKSQLKMYDMIFYNPISNPMKNALTIKEDRRSSSAASSISSFVGKRDPSIPTGSIPPLPVKSKSEENAMPVPQLKIGPNGDIIIDEKSLVIETTSEKTARETLANSDIVYDDEFSGTQGFYKRQLRMRDWGRAETIKFYRCLQTIGTDFSMMIQLFPKRNRRELKLKFKKEEKMNPGLINKALLCPKTFDIDELEQDFKRDEEIERLEVEKLKQKRLQAQKEISSLAKSRLAIPKHYKSRTYQYLQKGDFIYENETLLTQTLIKHRRTRSKIYENWNKRVSNKRMKLDERDTSTDQPDADDVIAHDELNNNDGENRYTPNLNIPETNEESIDVLLVNDATEYDDATSVLSNGNGFNTLVNNCGKSYFSSDMTINKPPTTRAINFSSVEETVSIIHTSDDSDNDGLIIDMDSHDFDEQTNVEQSNYNKTDNRLVNELQSNSKLEPSSVPRTNEFDNEFLNRLVAVEIVDAKNVKNKQYQFYTIIPETGNLSEDPIDLPPDIVEAIITKCCKK